ncbi:MAG: methyltransferase [Lysobacteraceae bacterium]|jgi:predicted methyltransferase
MKRSTLSLALVLVLAACGGQPPSAPAEPVAPEPPPPPAMQEAPTASALEQAIAGDWRTPEFVARDAHRHPQETLAFFGIDADSRVVEITPGGGWYAEILAPLVRESGRYIGAVIDENAVDNERSKAYYARTNQALRDKFAAAPEVFGAAELVGVDPLAPVFAEPGSVDAVLTFRNVHNWLGTAGQAEAMFAGFFAALEPGGVLGVVEHRAAGELPDGDRSGYVSEARVIALAEAAGFVLDASSEINANPADSKDHPNGVWTLPPSLNVPEGEDAEKYRAIGESDRMTLRFRKPAEG